MSRRIAMLLCSGCLLLLSAEASVAESVTYTTPGRHDFTVPAGVTNLHVVAIGGRGGGIAGGYGAVVEADVAVRDVSALVVEVPSNGSIGAAGTGRGGAPPLGSLAGGGGGRARVVRCMNLPSCTSVFVFVAAAGGGGAGADSLPGLGGAGGAAGSAGAAAETVNGVAGGGGGQPGTRFAGAGGTGGAAPAPGCDPGDAGTTGGGAGGTGGMSADVFGFGDGGGGGAGGVAQRGGGGGGAGGYCAGNDEGLGGGGGGGGGSLMPIDGTVAVDTTGLPSVTISWSSADPGPSVPIAPSVPIDPRIRSDRGIPAVTIAVPADGHTYERGQALAVSFRCEQGTASTALVTCNGTRANGRPLGTADVGDYDFKVIARTEGGARTQQIVSYTVDDTLPPEILRLRIDPRTIDLDQPRALARVRFRLNEPGFVRIRLKHLGSRDGARVWTRSGKLGRNGFTLRARGGRGTLAAGDYALRLVAIDELGNHSRPVTRRFAVLG